MSKKQYEDLIADLTRSETAIFEYMHKYIDQEVELDKIYELLDRKGMVPASRHSLAVRMKYLAAKTAPFGCIIDRVSGRGRGQFARYKMTRGVRVNER